MHNAPMPSIRDRAYGPQLRDALNCIEALVVGGLQHGFFEYSLTGEIGKDGRRQLVIRAGMSHKFTIPESELPG
jgi:hypothetical protein